MADSNAQPSIFDDLGDVSMPSVSPTAQAESLDTLLGIADSDSDPLQNLDTIISQATLGPTFSPTALQQLASDAPTALLQALATLAPTVLFSGGGAGLGLADSPADAPGRAPISTPPSFDDDVSLLYDIYALVLAVFFPLATFCGVRFEALLCVPGLNIWACALGFVIATEAGLENDLIAKMVFAAAGCCLACAILYTMGLFSLTLMGIFAGVVLGAGMHDFFGQYINQANDSDVEWSKVIYLGLCPLLFMVLVVGTDWRGQAIMWSFSGAYFGVAMVDWMGYRWDYTDEPRMWPSNFLTSKTTLSDCDDSWCTAMLTLWGCLTALGLWVQLTWGPLPPASVDGSDLKEWEPLMWELEQKYNFKGEALEEMAKVFASTIFLECSSVLS